MTNPTNLSTRLGALVQRLTRTHKPRDPEIAADIAATRAVIETWARAGVNHIAPDRMFAILSFTNLPLHAKFHGLLAKAMQLEGYTPLIFTYAAVTTAHEYFEMFGIGRDKLVFWRKMANHYAPRNSAFQKLIDSLIPSDADALDMLDVTLHGVEIGKHALSMTARNLIQAQLNLRDPHTRALYREHFAKSAQAVMATERLLEQYPIKKMLVRDAGYVPNGAIYETALRAGVDCITYEQGLRRGTWFFKRYTTFESKSEHYSSLSSKTWAQAQAREWTPAQDTALDAIFAGRYKPDSTEDTRRLQSGKLLKTPEQVRAQLGLDPAKKTAVIFSHIAWDAAFFYGTCLFGDFENWLYETVRFVAAECPDMNWVVKLHPFNVFKLKREGIGEESEMRLLRPLMPLPDHVTVMRADTDINTQSLFPLVDAVLTVIGTVGMEFPCFGVPAILAGTGRYHGRGFTVDHDSIDSYWHTLRHLHKMPRLDTATQTRARRYYYTLMSQRQTALDDIAPMEIKRLSEAQSDVHDNISITAHSLAEFESKTSIQRLRAWLAHSDESDILEPLA